MHSGPDGTYQSSIQATELKRLIDIIATALSAANERIAKQAGEIAELESGYQNCAKLALTYHGEVERANERIARLEGALQPMIEGLKCGMNEWRPIETAPKDETWILLYFPAGSGVSDSNFAVGFWSPDGDWFAAEWSSNPLTVFGSKPTHWMPLPGPPVTATPAGKGDSNIK